MFNLARPLKPEDYLSAAWKRKWWIIISFVLISAAGITYILHMPKVYRSSTLILIIPQRVPPDYVRPTVTSPIEERLSTINTQIMSRTNLGRVIDGLGLYKDTAEGLSRGALIGKMRKNIEVRLKGIGKREAFEVFYAGENPHTVMTVTNRLASLFIEQNLKIREQLAEGTADFLSDQLKEIEADLEQKEQLITEFKKKYMGELPEQLHANLSVLGQLQTQYQRVTDRLTAAQDRRAMFLKQISDIKEMEYDDHGPAVSIERLEEELANLRLRYRDKHPDVLMLQRKIEELEAKTVEQQEGGAETKKTTGRTLGRANREAAMQSELNAQLASVDAEIRRLRVEEARIKDRIDGFETRIENTPWREQEMISLTRDYENMKRSYSSLLAKKLESEQAMALEQRQQGEQFRILDPAELPTVPWKPDVPRLVLLTMAVALGVGCGLAFLMEYRDRSFKDPEDVKAFVQLPVLAVVPKIQMDKDGKIKEKAYGYLKYRKYTQSRASNV